MLGVWHTPPTNAENHRVRGTPGADLIQPRPPPPFILGTKSHSQDKGPATHSVGVLAKMQTGQRSFEQTLLWLPSSCSKIQTPRPCKALRGPAPRYPSKMGLRPHQPLPQPSVQQSLPSLPTPAHPPPQGSKPRRGQPPSDLVSLGVGPFCAPCRTPAPPAAPGPHGHSSVS